MHAWRTLTDMHASVQHRGGQEACSIAEYWLPTACRGSSCPGPMQCFVLRSALGTCRADTLQLPPDAGARRRACSSAATGARQLACTRIRAPDQAPPASRPLPPPPQLSRPHPAAAHTLSHMLTLRCSMASARSHTERALRKSFCCSSHVAYCRAAQHTHTTPQAANRHGQRPPAAVSVPWQHRAAGSGRRCTALSVPTNLDPDGPVEAAHAAHEVLKLLALCEAVLCELLRVCDDLLWRLEVVLKLDLLGLPQQLLRCNLLVRGLLVLHLGGARQARVDVGHCGGGPGPGGPRAAPQGGGLGAKAGWRLLRDCCPRASAAYTSLQSRGHKALAAVMRRVGRGSGTVSPTMIHGWATATH